MIEMILAAAVAVASALGWAMVERGRRREAQRRADSAEAGLRARREIDDAVDHAGGRDPREWLRDYAGRD